MPDKKSEWCSYKPKWLSSLDDANTEQGKYSQSRRPKIVRCPVCNRRIRPKVEYCSDPNGRNEHDHYIIIPRHKIPKAKRK